jgi:hypothetical protein
VAGRARRRRRAEPPRGLRHAADDLPAEQRRSFLVGLRNARRAAAEPLQRAREGARTCCA